MKRPSYKKAIAWVAMNDSAADDGALDPAVTQELVSAVLIAEVFDVPTDKVGRDIVAYRQKEAVNT